MTTKFYGLKKLTNLVQDLLAGGKKHSNVGMMCWSEIQHMARNLATQRLLHSEGMHPKLTVSQVGDVDEQEADRIAKRRGTSCLLPWSSIVP